MKKFMYHPANKTFLAIFASILLFCTVVSGISTAFLLQKHGYSPSWERVEKLCLEEHYIDVPHQVAWQWAANDQPSFYAWLDWLEEKFNFRCKISNEFGSVLFSDYNGEKTVYKAEETFYFFTDENGNLWEGKNYDSGEYHVTLYGFEPEDGSYFQMQMRLLKICYHFRYIWIGGAFGGAILFVLLMILLCSVSGKKEKEGELTLGFWSRVPTEVIFGIWAVLLVLQFFALDAFITGETSLLLVLILAASFLAVDCVLCVLSIVNLALRIKSRTLWRNTLVWRFGKPLYLLLQKGFRFLRSLWKDFRLEPKLVILLVLLAFFNLFLASFLNYSEFLAAALIEGILLSIVLLWYAVSIQLLHRDLSHRIKGNLEYRSDLSRLPPSLRSFGEDLNRSAEGMENALEEKMKSERFKTELITGVSHDLKTPLTSIVNFVDLMKKEEIENEKVREYLDVLDRQSARLKKLTEDLVESSKAASGVLPVDLQRLDLKVLMEQAEGEYRSFLEEKGLIPVFRLPQEAVYVLADGKRFWRVLDNLMTNVSKYALTGTRVYAELFTEQDTAWIVLKNISALPLSFSGEDLTERFVRGDASRNTEGSGLGLAIAKSFVELQKGQFEVSCDGDLFKVRIRFDILK